MDSHLSQEQIEDILRRMLSDGGAAFDRLKGSKEVLEHLERCGSCVARLHEEQEMIEHLKPLKLLAQGARTTNCPPDVVWQEIGSGVKVDKGDEYLRHAACCDHCGPLLNQEMADFRTDLSPAEENTISHLRTSDPAWQTRLAKMLSERNSEPKRISFLHPGRTPVLTRWILWPAAGLLALVVTFYTATYIRSRPDDLETTNRLINEAYATQRTLPFRFIGAGYAPVRLNRGEDELRENSPLPLLQAETQIAAHLANGNRDRHWILASAKADLLKGNYERAVHELEPSVDEASPVADEDITIATAYFERWQQKHTPEDLGNAIESIGRALDREPKNPVALYNKGLIDEGSSLYSVAISDWNRYLEVDSTSAWSIEARAHLTNCQRILENKQKSTDNRNLPAAEVIGALQPYQVGENEIDKNIEAYQLKVFTSYLPDLVSRNRSTQVTSEERAIHRIAEISAHDHKDRLLLDLIASTQPRAMSKPTKELASAIALNHAGNEQLALEYAQRADEEFAGRGNRAGSLRARFEEIYALQFISRTKECAVKANRLAADASRDGYSWLKAEAEIEIGFCNMMSGDLARASESLKLASQDARDAHYEAVLDRALVGEAGIQWQTGSVLEAWNIALSGLNHFWSSSEPYERGESYCDFLDEVAEQRRQWHLQSAVLSESISFLGQEQDHLEEAQVLLRLANSQLMLHRSEQAKSTLEKALASFKTAPPTPATQVQELMARINLAKVEAANRNYAASLSLLTELQSQIALLHEDLSLIEYFATLGEVYRKLGYQPLAEKSDLSAIGIFKKGLGTLSHDRDRLTWRRHIAPAYRSLVQLRINQNRISDALRVWEEYRDVRKDPVWDAAEASRSSVPAKASLSDPETVLVYATLPDGPFVWAISAQDLKAMPLRESNEELALESSRFAGECSTPASDIGNLKADANRLYRILLSPLASLISNHEALVVELDDDLVRIPFNALVDDQGNYLNATHIIAVSPFSGVNTPPISLRTPLEKNDAALLVESRRSLDDKEREDSESELEIEEVASHFPNNRILRSAPSVRASFLQLLKRSELFHYAGHSASSGNGGALLLRDDDPFGREHVELLRSDDLEGLHLRGKLAVLSACQTDRGEGTRWLDRDNVAVTLLLVGFREVVSSRWDVDSSATIALMQAFYSDLARGKSAAGSLRNAEERVRSTPEFDHPFFWAAFSVQERL